MAMVMAMAMAMVMVFGQPYWWIGANVVMTQLAQLLTVMLMDLSATNRALTKRLGQDHFLKIKTHFEFAAGLGRMAAPGIMRTG